MYEWNPVFRFVMDIKRRYTEKFGEPEYKTYIAEEKEISSLEHWIVKLGDKAAEEFCWHFVREQVEEEATSGGIVDKLKNNGEGAIILLDHVMASR